ncbi:MAG TPA: DUF3108 domain-containing protein [Burkholderiales bacterium]|nr:DUF3108 domain-containing protein [Burkholderiales bacterium]
MRLRFKPLLMAVVLSVLAHAIALSGGWLQLRQTMAGSPPDAPPLVARLEPLTLPAAALVPPVKRTKQPRPATLAAASVTVKSDMSASWVLPVIPSGAEPVTEAEPLELPATIAQPESSAPATDPVVIARVAPSHGVPDLAVTIKTLPRRGRITYNLNYYLSNMPTTVGRTVQTWEAADNAYKLDSLSETVGLARLTRFGPRVYHSSGVVTLRGLQPHRFTSKVVISGNADDSAAQFDWDMSTLQFGRPADQKHTALPAGAQDLLSFMYQLSLAPPPRGRVQIPVTTGVRFENYEFDVFDEETIETPLGNIRALPVKQVPQSGSESIEVWLATEYHYLPVRIRFIGRDGTPGGEQVAAEISIGEK